MPETPGSRELEPSQEPKILDIVKIDGRWAQVSGGGGVVRYLEDDSSEQIDWDDYRLLKHIGLSVENFIDTKGGNFSDDEIINIYSGTDAESETLELSRQVMVFGEYAKK